VSESSFAFTTATINRKQHERQLPEKKAHFERSRGGVRCGAVGGSEGSWQGSLCGVCVCGTILNESGDSVVNMMDGLMKHITLEATETGHKTKQQPTNAHTSARQPSITLQKRKPERPSSSNASCLAINRRTT
jgi:hypothetical protein